MKKEKPIKMSFTIAVIIIEFVFLISMITVYYFYQIAKNRAQSKQNLTEGIEIIEDNDNKEEVKDNTEKKELKGETYKKDNSSSNIEWEEYPEDDKWMDETTRESLKKDSTMYRLIRKTIYSLKQNKVDSFVDRYNSILAIGDSTEIVDWTSNYARYCYPDNENNNLTSKYTKKILYDIADFDELYYEGYYDLNTLVKSQYNKLVVKKDYEHFKNVPDSFYYIIPNMIIMNGNNESEEEYKNNARAKKVKITINNEKTYIFDLKDTNRVQVFELGYKQDSIEKPVHIETEVVEKYKGEKTEDVYISDIQFGIESNIPQGR